MQSYLARTGVAVFAFLFAFALFTEQSAAGRALVASENVELPALRELVRPVAAAPLAAPAPEEASAASTPEPVATPAAAIVIADGLVLASWYGPGFYGNRTACGQTYTPQILGVAHKTLPCGTPLQLTYGGRSITVPVIDRGPYVAGRTLDLSNATKLALGCTDLCTLRMQVLR